MKQTDCEAAHAPVSNDGEHRQQDWACNCAAQPARRGLSTGASAAGRRGRRGAWQRPSRGPARRRLRTGGRPKHGGDPEQDARLRLLQRIPWALGRSRGGVLLRPPPRSPRPASSSRSRMTAMLSRPPASFARAISASPASAQARARQQHLRQLRLTQHRRGRRCTAGIRRRARVERAYRPRSPSPSRVMIERCG